MSDKQLQEFHATCESFERALRSGEDIRIEDYLTQASGEFQDLLFHELLAIELEGRLPNANSSDVAAYLARFPDRCVDIERVSQEVFGNSPVDENGAMGTHPHGYNRAMSDVTKILTAIELGDEGAADRLLPLVYQELRKLAAARLAKEKQGQTLQPTILVHEAYLRLVDVDQPQQWNGRGHFFGAAAEAMRRILVERARRKKSQKYGGHMHRVELDVATAAIENPVEDLLALDEALTRFEQQWPDKAKLVKLKYFAGLTIPEASEAMGVSSATAERYWKFARAWLHSQLKSSD